MAFLLVVLFDGAAGFGHKSNWSSVCELEAARGLVEKAARSAAVESTTPQAPTLRLWVGRAEGVPLTVAAGAVAQAGYFGSNAARHLTISISIDGKPSCPGTGRRSTVTLQMATTRALRKSHRHHRHQHQHEQLLSRYANPAKPAERVVLDAVFCDGRKKLAKQRAVTRVVDAKSLKLCRSSVTPPPMPPRSDPSALLALLEARTNAQILLAKATEELARRLGRRGTLCDHKRPCSARILPQCPDGCIARDANASCVFAHLEAGAPKEIRRITKTCVEVCFSELAVKHVWRADVSRGGDARDAFAHERCRVLHIHMLAAWWRRYRVAFRAETKVLWTGF